MPWPADNLTSNRLNAGGDDPSLARAEILRLIEALQAIIAGRATINGICELDADGRIPANRYRVDIANSLLALRSDTTFNPTRMPYVIELERRNNDIEVRLRNWDGTWGAWTDLTGE